MKRWLVRTEEDPTCKCTVEAETRENAIAQAAFITGCAAEELLAVESPCDDARFTVRVKCGEQMRTARLTLGEWRDLARFAQGLCLPNNPPAFILVGGIVVWSNEA